MKLSKLLEAAQPWSVEDLKWYVGVKHYFSSIEISAKGLRSLKGSPKKVEGNFVCAGNSLKTLDGGPEYVGGNYSCTGGELTSLEGIAKEIGGCLDLSDNNLTSLKDLHKQILRIASNRKIIIRPDVNLDVTGNPIKSRVLGLLKIKGMKNVLMDNVAVQAIINKHLNGDRDIFACQEELEDMGFPEYAKV